MVIIQAGKQSHSAALPRSRRLTTNSVIYSSWECLSALSWKQ